MLQYWIYYSNNTQHFNILIFVYIFTNKYHEGILVWWWWNPSRATHLSGWWACKLVLYTCERLFCCYVLVLFTCVISVHVCLSVCLLPLARSVKHWQCWIHSSSWYSWNQQDRHHTSLWDMVLHQCILKWNVAQWDSYRPLDIFSTYYA